MKKPRPSVISRVRDIIVYALIGVGVVAVALAVADNARPGAESPAKWYGFILFTAGLFGISLKEGRPFWGVRAFWMGFGLVFVLHLLVFIPLLRALGHVPAIYFVPVYLFEIPVLGHTVDWFLENFGTDKKRRGR